jgi:hypothetical protein
MFERNRAIPSGKAENGANVFRYPKPALAERKILHIPMPRAQLVLNGFIPTIAIQIRAFRQAPTAKSSRGSF